MLIKVNSHRNIDCEEEDKENNLMALRRRGTASTKLWSLKTMRVITVS